MAQYGKNNYFDGVILPEPKEETLRRMAKGVKLGYGEKNVYSSSSNGTILTSLPIQIGTSDFSIEYYGNAYGSGGSSAPLLFNKASLGTPNAPTYFQVYGLTLGRNALNWVAFGIPDGGNIATDSLNFNYSAPDLNTKFHLVITRQGRMINVYIDNTLLASKEQTEIKDLGAFVLGILNSSDVGFARVWNYALPAAEVSALWNNGDPVGYVLPDYYKYRNRDYVSDFTSGTDGWAPAPGDTGVTSVSSEGGALVASGVYDTDRGIAIYKSDLTPGIHQSVYSVHLTFQEPLPATITTISCYAYSDYNGFMLTISSDRLEAFGTRRPSDLTVEPYLFLYFRGASASDVVKISSIRLEAVGCVAEYLPGNLIPTAEGSVIQWLDSAPQLPEANGILLPLDASVGGYDLAAVGTPKIIV